MSEPEGQPGWEATWEERRRAQLTVGLSATPAQRLAWLEEAIAFAFRTGALPRRADTGDTSYAGDTSYTGEPGSQSPG